MNQRELVACAGGWCRQRERCAHYTSPSRVISERLCEKGKDDPEPVIEYRVLVAALKQEAKSA